MAWLLAKGKGSDIEMERICEGDVLFFCWDHGRAVDDVITLGKNDTITSIHVPKCVTWHKRWDCYWFPNLLEILAHPESPRYVSYDGALYTRAGELLYVPHGKKTLELAPFLKSISHRAFWDHNNLEAISIDRSNEYFHVHHGCLYSKDNHDVYCVANAERTLYLCVNTRYVSEDVLSQQFQNVIIENGNPFYETYDGMLIHDSWILHTGHKENVCIPPSVTTINVETAIDLFKEDRIATAVNHPVYSVRDSSLFNERDRKLIYHSPKAVRLSIPDGYTLERGSLHSAHLESALVPYDMQISMEAFYPPGEHHIRDMGQLFVQELTLRWPDGRTCTFPGDIVRCLHAAQSGAVEVKAGTEIMFLEMFLSGRIIHPKQRWSFAVSAFQILTCLIDQNDIARFGKVICDGKLITRKNIKRLRIYAQEHGRTEIVEMLRNLQL